MRTVASLGIVVLSFVLAGHKVGASGWEPEFHIIPDFPGGQSLSVPWSVSADGSTVVGYSDTNQGREAFVWTKAAGMQHMPATDLGRPYTAWDVSANGAVVVGELETAGGYQAFRWSHQTGYELIATQFADLTVKAAAVSDDGSVVVGHAHSSTQPYFAWVWTAATGVHLLGDLPGGRTYSEARDISGDGSTIVGVSASEEGNEAFRWTLDDGMEGLGILPSTVPGSGSQAVSFDGTVIAGHSSSDGFTAIQATRWDAAEGLSGIGVRQSGPFYWSEAWDISADGARIVGQHFTNRDDSAFIWHENHGIRSLEPLLRNDYGLDQQMGGWHLQSAMAISADGRVMAGTTRGAAWVAIVPEPSAFAIGLVSIALGTALVRRRR